MTSLSCIQATLSGYLLSPAVPGRNGTSAVHTSNAKSAFMHFFSELAKIYSELSSPLLGVSATAPFSNQTVERDPVTKDVLNQVRSSRNGKKRYGAEKWCGESSLQKRIAQLCTSSECHLLSVIRQSMVVRRSSTHK